MSMPQHTTPLVASQITASPGIKDSTARKRQERFRHFQRWCESRILPSLPTTDAVLARYVGDDVGHLSFSTIRARVEAVRATHQSMGHPWFAEVGVRRELEAARKAVGNRNSVPLVERDLVDLATSLVAERSFEAIRDWALISLGAAGGFDSRELVTLESLDVVINTQGMWLPTLADAWGKVPFVPRHADGRRCPVVALEVWKALRDASSETLFHDDGKGGGVMPLRAVDVTTIVRRRMGDIGRDARRYGAPSLKAHKFFGSSTRGGVQ